MRYTYSRWDGTQSVEGFDPDELIEALSDDLMADGDLWSALQRVMRWGLPREDGERAPGLQNVLQQLRAQRQADLERYNLDALMEDLAAQVADVVQTERGGIERRREEAAAAGGDQGAQAMLERVMQRKERFLDNLSPDPAAAIAQLSDYEFLDEEAREKFSALMDTLQRQVLQSHVQALQQSLQDMTAGDIEDVTKMLGALNQMLEDRMAGESADFGRFREQYGHYFPGLGSLEELIAHLQDQAASMQSLLSSMAPETRRALERTLQSVLRDEALRDELARLAEALQALAPLRRPTDYPFSGDESVTLEEALRLMRRMQDLDQLEKDLRRAQESGDLEGVQSEQVGRLMGDEAYVAVERLKQLAQVLEEAGYVERSDGSFQLTARGIRRIGQKALQDIFHRLSRDAFGNHSIAIPGAGADQADQSKAYEFGDSFLLDMTRTLMNSLQREGAGSPLRLAVGDFEVFRTEQLAQASTVLMLDMSRSMPLRGCFVAAKKVALALNSLIRMQFPRDRLYIVGFSDYARELRPEALHQITWGDYVYGTNMQHGFVLARRLLGRHAGGNKQIILITDGEPTAHFEGDRVHFSYPPTFRTFQETLREVKRCTQEGIIINTFMLERSHYLADFVTQMTRINHGRAFFATPERLGDYILVDYVTTKRKHG